MMRYLVTWKHHALARQYDIRRSTTVDGPWTALGITSDCFFIDEVAEGTYYYQVRARFLTRWTDWSAVSDVLALGASYRPEDSYTRFGAQFTAASSQYLSVASNAELQGNANKWVSGWFFMDNLTSSPGNSTHYLVFKNNEYAILVNRLGKITFQINDGSGTRQAIPANVYSINTWYHFFGWVDSENETVNMRINAGTGNDLNSVAYDGTIVTTSNVLNFGTNGTYYYDGRQDNLLTGNAPTSLGDGTAGSLAHTIATALFNSNNGLAFQDITAQQQTDWGIVSGWLGNSLTQDYFGTNHLTNNNGVTQAIGKVAAVAVENDPVYILEDSSGNSKNVSQTTLASRPVWKDAIINGYPVLVFDGTDDLLSVSSIGSLSFPLALYAVFKVDTLGRRNISTVGTPVDRLDLMVEQGNVVSARALTITPFAIPQSTLPFTDVENWHRLCGVFESNNKRTVYLDDTTGTPETTAMTNSLTGYGLYLGNTVGNDFDFDGQIAFACLIPNWTLEKQKAVDRYSLLTFFTVPDFAVNPFTSDSLSISWSAFASGTVLEYELQKATAVNGPWTTILRTTATTYTDTGLTEGSTYYYRVRAVVSNGVTGWSTGSATVVEFEPIFLNPQLLLLPENSYSRTGGQFAVASSQYLSMASNSSVQVGLGVPFWFSLWCNPTAINTGLIQIILAKDQEYDIRVGGSASRLEFTNTLAPNYVTAPLSAGVWQHFFCYSDGAGNFSIIKDGGTPVTISYSNWTANTNPLQIGARSGAYFYGGLLDNILFGKSPTESFANIAAALFAAGDGLPFQSITDQQQSDWGIVSGWLDNSLTIDAFGTNHLTNNNGVTQAAGKVNAIAIANDPVYFIEDASNSNNDITQTALTSSPFFAENVANGNPSLVFDGVNDFLPFSIPQVFPFYLYAVVDTSELLEGLQCLLSSSTSWSFQLGDGGGNAYKPRLYGAAPSPLTYSNPLQTRYIVRFSATSTQHGIAINAEAELTAANSSPNTLGNWVRVGSHPSISAWNPKVGILWLGLFQGATISPQGHDGMLEYLLREFFQVLDVVTTNIGTTTVSLEWAAFTTITPTEYEVQRATAAEGPWTEIGTSATADYDDTGLTEGTTYYYRVRANTAKGYSAWSTAISARPGIYVNAILGSDNDYVTSESAEVLFDDLRLEAINSSATTIVLTYDLSELTATGYEVQRSLAVDGPWTTISTAAGPYIDSGRIEGTTYYYRARANTASGWTSWSVVSRKAGLLLDSVSGAIIAYSLRQLRVDYSGPAIRVRRSSDNAEQDIGFVNGVLDTATLLTFVGAGSGFVTTWYDQSANGFHASQSVEANQPLIVFLGSLFTVNSLAAVDFTAGASQSLSTSVNIGLVGDPPHSVALVHQVDSVTTVVFATGSASTNTAFSYWIGYAGLYNWGYGNFQGLDVPVPAINTQYLELYFKSPGLHTVTSSAYRNGLNAGTTSDATAPAITNNRFWLGGWIGGANYMYDGKIQELILFNEDHRDIRSTIESNINNHYNVY